MTPQETERLIGDLARDAAQTGTPSRSPRIVLSAAAALAFALAITLAVVVFGSGDDPGAAFDRPWTYWKLLCMATLGFGAWRAMHGLAQPSYAPPRFAVLAAALVLLMLGAILDPSGLSIAGRHSVSVPICLTAIVLQSLPGIILLLLGLRSVSVTTRPTLTGAAAGLLAGAIGAAAYAIVCRNDGGLFVFVWYSVGVSIATAIGAALGRRMLTW